MSAQLSAIGVAMAMICYAFATVGYGGSVFLGGASAPANTSPSVSRSLKIGRPLLWLGILIQFVAIGVWCASTHRSPFAGQFGTFSVTGWGIAIVFAFSEWRSKVSVVGTIALPVACVALLVAILNTGGKIAETQILADRLVSLHVIAILLSFGLFVVAFACAALYLVQNRLLRTHNRNCLFRKLPPLETLDSIAYHSVAYALPLLTIGLILGTTLVFSGVTQISPQNWLIDPHTFASFGVWLLYIFYVVARLGGGWRGVRLQYILLYNHLNL